jgi:LysR family glycine cleavage system transcriptional activator/LysR family transcriptional regulator of beta-lactamase
MDRLVQSELREEKLFRLSDIALENYGYFLIRSRRKPVSDMALVFSEWILNQV